MMRTQEYSFIVFRWVALYLYRFRYKLTVMYVPYRYLRDAGPRYSVSLGLYGNSVFCTG